MESLNTHLLQRIAAIAQELDLLRSALAENVTEERSLPATPPERQYEKKEAAHYFGVSYRTLNRWIENGLLSGCYVGKRYRISQSELYRFMQIHANDKGEVRRVEYARPDSLESIRQKYARRIEVQR